MRQQDSSLVVLCKALTWGSQWGAAGIRGGKRTGLAPAQDPESVTTFDRICFFFQAEDGIRDVAVTGVQTCALPISSGKRRWIAGLAVALVLALVAAAVFLSRRRSSQQEISSLAVLPFVNPGNDPNTEYLSDGLTQSPIQNLSPVPHLSVIFPSSGFFHKGR